ncbi:hypothetical protein [Streptomyces tropicalis]|uniref:Secreted protein n=1 Tax=Streptomyces tropicalis TaxID=3034234 RepID=A0ABT6A5M8_9ACTN|nr:hypothetical protein [Streptomyces tropicalis]MDF3299948.1 hypothetical protein [Streptomyces tropicalis]
MPTLTLPRINGTRAGAVAALAAFTAVGASWLAAPAAVAAPGDNGDIKIHRVGVPFGVSKDDPVVCRFYLDGVNFDALTAVTYTIQAQPPLPTASTVTGSVVLAGGAGHTDPIGLTDGQYKLVWVVPGGNPKEKIFRVHCREENTRPGGALGPGGRIEDPGRGGEEQGRGDGDQHGAATAEGDHRGGPQGGVHAGGGGLVSAAAAFSPVAGAAAVGLVVISGVVYLRMIRRRNHGAA